MNQNEPMTVQFHTYPELPIIDVNQMVSLAAQTKTLFGHGAKAWIQTFQAITIIRSINKQVPQHVNHLFEMFGPDIMNSFDDVKPIIQRNVIALLSEVFQTGMTIQILPQIFSIFLPKLIIKSQTSEQKMIKDECMVCISHFVINCSFHESGLLAITQLSADNKKPISVQKFSLQLLASAFNSIQLKPYQQQCKHFAIYWRVENKKFRLLSSKQVLFPINWWENEPSKYLQGVIDVCRAKPHLIRLFRVEELFKNLNLKLNFESGTLLSNKLMVDKELQTPTHFVEKNLDPNYCWNEWELRRKAIQMANIRKRQTKAQQTILSNFKVDSEAQVYEMKEKETSTGQNQGLNPLRPRNYIVGLRDKGYTQ